MSVRSCSFFNCGFKWTGSKGKIVREVVKHMERSRVKEKRSASRKMKKNNEQKIRSISWIEVEAEKKD